MKKSFDVSQHYLVPKQSKLKDKEKKEFLEKYKITLLDLPKILLKDPAIQHLDAQAGDIIKIIRKSPTAGSSIYYRGVVSE